MIINKTNMKKEIRKEMRGGTGEVEITHYVEKEKLKNARLLAHLKLNSGSSIGMHEHKDETEYFIILNGKGLAIDDGLEKQVEKGDVIITGNGASHSIKNIGNETLEIIAIIITH